MLSTERVPVLLDPAGETFCALTVIEGQIELRGNGWSLALDRFESAVLPASAGSCTITASSRARVLAASVEE
jgi:mannose-6-phosphate isomerase class I